MLKLIRHWLHRLWPQSHALLQPPIHRAMSQVAFNPLAGGFGFGGSSPAIALHRANGGRKPVKLEVLVIDDLSFSASSRAQVICDTTRAGFEALEKKALEVRFGYIGSRDRDFGEADEVRVIHGTSAQVLREQMTVTRAGGGDAAETFGDTIVEALDTYPFTNAPDVVGAILLLCTDHTKPTAAGLTPFQVGERCKAMRKHLFVVGEPGSNTADMVAGAGAYGGGFLELKANPTPQEVQVIAQKLTGTLVGSLTQAPTGTVPASALLPTGLTVPAP